MKERDDSDARIRAAFAAARRIDREATPPFGEARPGQGRIARPRRAFPLWVAASATAAVAVIAAGLWPERPAVSPPAPPAPVERAVPVEVGERIRPVAPVEVVEVEPPAAPAPPVATPTAGPGESSPAAPTASTAPEAPSHAGPPAELPSPRPRESRPTAPEAIVPQTDPSAERGAMAILVVERSHPLPGAIVTLRHETGLVQPTALLTNKDGAVRFEGLRAGTGYTAEVSFPGFGVRRLVGLDVRGGDTSAQVVQLTEELSEHVEVVAAEYEAARLQETARETTFTDEFIRDLPVAGRFHQNVLTLAPGVQDADGDGNPNVHGSRDRDFKVIVSGVTNDALGGRSSRSVNPNSIEELEVITSGATVEFERAYGGFAAAVGVPDAAPEPPSVESYDAIVENGFRAVLDHPLSTFSIDVDTASYANVRRMLNQGVLPPANAVRIEELINYFPYDYAPPNGEAPFATHVEVADCPWAPSNRLVKIGLKGRELSRGELAGSNLVFLIDVSGSMQQPQKLPLLRDALAVLVGQLDGRDTVSIVVYAGASGLVLEPTSGDRKAEILGALARLEAGGGTNGGAGLELAYRVARENFLEGGVNRVILATDGDFNLGVSDRGELQQRIEKDARRGIALTTLGFGFGNLKDGMLEQLADRGNGNYAYIDTLDEARKVLGEELGATLVTIANDVKIQVEFNPAEVAAYRLIGYENRMLQKEDFNDDRKDAGEIGAGHTVTALYEIVPAGVRAPTAPVDPLLYQSPSRPNEAAQSGELLTLKLRYKHPEDDTSQLLTFPVRDAGLGLGAASEDFRFAAAVAAFGMTLRDSGHRGNAGFDLARRLAAEGRGPDRFGYRAGFAALVDRAAALAEGTSAQSD